jgi:bifunctional non-homologous end joining protein LigD
MRLSDCSEPFDSDRFVFELQIDGLRALAQINEGQGKLISRNGRAFRGFADLAVSIAKHLPAENAVLDGEVACLDESGRPSFRDLLLGKGDCRFIAFDLLFLDGKDLRTLPLVERKARLENLLPPKPSAALYLHHIQGDGRLLFEQIVALDLEGIVCKQKDSPYKATDKPSRYWMKVKNAKYTSS